MIGLFDDLEQLSRAAAGLFAESARKAIEIRGRFSVLVSGGETPRRTYQLLAEAPHLADLPWDRVDLFFGDERCVPAGDPASNCLMLQKALLDRVPLPEAQIHPIQCEKDPGTAAIEYERVLAGYFAGTAPVFDLVLLGLGDDGHTASLFPGSPALKEQHRWTAVTRKAGEEIMRVTLTAPLLNRASRVLFLVAGPGKARILKDVLEGSRDPDRLPAQLIKPDGGELRWLVDRSAAGLLSAETLKG